MAGVVTRSQMRMVTSFCPSMASPTAISTKSAMAAVTAMAVNAAMAVIARAVIVIKKILKMALHVQEVDHHA